MAVEELRGQPDGPAPVILFGGTFDPVHVGHLRSALDLMEYLEVPRLRLIPSRLPPHRETPLFTSEQRIRMLELAVASLPGVQVDLRECRREGPSYTVDTLRSFREELGHETPLLLVLGFDAFAELHRWHHWTQVTELCSLVVLKRPGYEGTELPEVLKRLLEERSTTDVSVLRRSCAGLVHQATLTQLQISASWIRQLIRSGRTLRFLVPDAVCEYIQQHQEVHA